MALAVPGLPVYIGVRRVIAGRASFSLAILPAVVMPVVVAALDRKWRAP